MALDHALITWQCCYSGLYWKSQSLSLLSAVGWVLCVAHKAATVEQNIWRWEPGIRPVHDLEVCLHTYSGLAPWMRCSFVAGAGCHELCSWWASSHLALPKGILLVCGVSWVMSKEVSWDLPQTHIPDPTWNGDVDTHEALHSLHLPPAAALVSRLFNH